MKKLMVILAMALSMTLVFVACASPSDEQEDPAGTETPADDASADEEASIAVAGTYTFSEESDMGISEWTLDLNEDGTYELSQLNPFGDTFSGNGKYTQDGNTVDIAAPAFTEGDRFMGEFVDEGDFSSKWMLCADNTAVPFGYEGFNAWKDAHGELGN